MSGIRFGHCALTILSAALVASSGTARPSPASPVSGEGRSPAMVIGIVGGFVRHDSHTHGVVQFAERLHREFPSGVYVEVFENHRWQQALESIERRLDANRDGVLSADEKRNARIVLYGHSWGGSEAVHLAAELAKQEIPILLTIQVDSVQKRGEKDSVIPTNVEQAVNFFQDDGWLHGLKEIRAADETRTQILGNIQFEYKSGSCPGYPWYNRWFTVPHCAIEIDSQVWDRADALIHSRLAASGQPAASNGDLLGEEAGRTGREVLPVRSAALKRPRDLR